MAPMLMTSRREAFAGLGALAALWAVPTVAAYQVVMASLKSGVEIPITIRRNDKEIKLKATPKWLFWAALKSTPNVAPKPWPSAPSKLS